MMQLIHPSDQNSQDLFWLYIFKYFIRYQNIVYALGLVTP